MDAQGRSVRLLSTYYPQFTNRMEAAYRRSEMESTVVLTSSPFDIVVCKDKVGENGE